VALNPVERQIALLAEHWRAFRDESGRPALVWRAPADAGRLIQCFFETQKLDLPYVTGDLFILVEPPFENSIQYARDVKTSLAGQYAASRDNFAQQGISTTWHGDPARTPDTPAGVVGFLRDFAAAVVPSGVRVVLVPEPKGVADEAAFAAWLRRLLDAGWPEPLRLLLVDRSDLRPRLGGAEKTRPDVAVQSPALDMLGTAQNAMAQEGGAGPGAVFRNLMMALMALVAKGGADAAQSKAWDALAFARKQNWPDQETAVWLMTAGAYLKEKRTDEALRAYATAREAARQATDAGHPLGRKLILQTWFGEAGVRFSLNDLEGATRCYDEAALVAQAADDRILGLEALRMAAQVRAQRGMREEALERGARLLELGATLPPEQRTHTTLPLAALDLIRTADPATTRRMADILREQEKALQTALSTAEAAIALCEREGGDLASLERTLAKQQSDIRSDATRKLLAAAQTGDEIFRGHFDRARSLLGDPWPDRKSVV
jgi:tetratricopeptide (TPR) repeat protein